MITNAENHQLSHKLRWLDNPVSAHCVDCAAYDPEPELQLCACEYHHCPRTVLGPVLCDGCEAQDFGINHV